MVPTKFFPALFGAALLLCSGASMAAEYRADEFLGLDLSKAVLSPKPLGPATEFAPVPVQAGGDLAKNDSNNDLIRNAHASDAAQMHARPAHTGVADIKIARIRSAETAAHRSTLVAHARLDKPKGAARTRLAHRPSNPLDAQAFDTRIQTWPCRSGGICDWKQ
jgi:hypothetical protein